MDRSELIQDIIENLAKCQRPALNASWKKLGLSHAQVGMLYLLYYHDDASVKETAEYLGITKSAITQLMDPLAVKGLVKRKNDAKDRRIVRLSLTTKGSTVVKRLAKSKLAGFRSALDSLNDKKLKELYVLHVKMAKSIK